MNIYILSSQIAIALSLIALIIKAGYPWWQALIPGYNIYLLAKILYIRIPLVMAISLYFFVPDKMMVITPVYILGTFIISDAYDQSPLFGFMMMLFPIFLYPYLALVKGHYIYDNCYFGKQNSKINNEEAITPKIEISQEPTPQPIEVLKKPVVMVIPPRESGGDQR